MNGAEWIVDKISSGDGRIRATAESPEIVFLQRGDKPDAYVGIVPTRRGDARPTISLEDVKSVHAQRPSMSLITAIPRNARWSGEAMKWLQLEGVAFGGVGDLLSAMNYDQDMSTHRNKTLEFVDDGLRRHSRVRDLEWIDSKCVTIHLYSGSDVTVALEDAYDITMTVAREAARTFDKFDILLKTNPNGSITSSGAENVERLGFKTLKWGELFGYLAKHG